MNKRLNNGGVSTSKLKINTSNDGLSQSKQFRCNTKQWFLTV